MIGCDNSIELKDLRKVVLQEGVRENTGRKERQGCKNCL